MSELEQNAFIGKKEPPTDPELAEALGRCKAVWDALVADLGAKHGVSIAEWKCYSVKTGWAARLKRKSRTVVWLTPCRGLFLVGFILGDKAVQAARECGLPAKVLEALDSAPKYPEGTGLRLLVKGMRDLPAIKKLAAVKLQN